MSKVEHNPENVKHNGQQTIPATENSFPVTAFPASVQHIINAVYDAYKFPPEYSGTSALFAAAVAIGKTHYVEVKPGYKELAVIFAVLVGTPGVRKTPTLDFFVKPLDEISERLHNEYTRELDVYEALKDQQSNKKKPVEKAILLTDVTPEKLIEIHNANPWGIGVHHDELPGWFNGFDRYHKGAESSMWNSVFSFGTIRYARKNSPTIYLREPFIPVAGTIQPDKLKALAADGRGVDGFLDRLVFAYLPNGEKPQDDDDAELPDYIPQRWASFIGKLLQLREQAQEPVCLSLTQAAKRWFIDWRRANTDEINEEENISLKGVYNKLERYVPRFALILQSLRCASGEDDMKEVGIEAMRGATDLAEYYRYTGVEVNSLVFDTNPIDTYPDIWKNFYSKLLADSFTTAEALKVGKSLEIAPRTVMDFIAKQNLFQHLKHGQYKKKYKD